MQDRVRNAITSFFEIVMSTISKKLHIFAGIIFLLYGISHFGFLTIYDPNHNFRNIVIPFLTNWYLYLLTGCLELIIGSICIANCGKPIVNVLILTFVGIMIWYKWAFAYAGGVDCGCIGIFGKLFHLSKTMAKNIPNLTLGFLFLITVPWIYKTLRIKFSKSHPNPAISAIFILFVVTSLGKASTAIQLSGLTDWQDYNFKTGVPINKYQVHNTFVAILSGRDWRISITNISTPEWWAQVICTDSETYIIQPATKFGIFDKLPNHMPVTNLHEVILEGSSRFLRIDDDINIDIGYFTYGLSQSSLKSNKQGIVEMPLPTGVVRQNPRAFGYKWITKFSNSELYPDSCEIIRDTSLDLTDDQEFLRPELDYPENLADFNSYKQLLEVRRQTPDGFVKSQYKCLNWKTVNGSNIPIESQLIVYWWDLKTGVGPKPWHVVSLKTTNIVVLENAPEIRPNVTTDTHVKDYRYKRSGSERIFKYADYHLAPNEQWKASNDPILLEKAEYFLKHGNKYADLTNRKEQWIIWFLLIIICLPLIIYGLAYWKKRSRSQN